MKVSKAIEILTLTELQGPPLVPQDYLDAHKLGIEALKARQRDRAHGYIDLDDLLPGETPEGDTT